MAEEASAQVSPHYPVDWSSFYGEKLRNAQFTIKNKDAPREKREKLIPVDQNHVVNIGCTMQSGNCEIPAWVYRGWTMPPCCRNTLKKLLFYAADLFRRYDIRFLITDGALLGSLKYFETPR
jgi:hypothetical protein